MFFLSTLFCGGRYSLDTTPPKTSSETSVTVSGCVADDLFVTGEVMTYDPSDTSIPSTWDYHTIMHAMFNGTLLAGNIDFYVDNVDFFRIKRRKHGDIKWINLHEFAITDPSDLNIDYIDMSPRSVNTYDYSVVPIIGGNEGSLYSNSITTKFRGLTVCDRSVVYNAYLDIELSQARNKPSSVVPTINRKYPFVISNGNINYDSGAVSALFAPFESENCTWDFKNGHSFRDEMRDFLYNGAPKIIKHEDGRMWLAAVSSAQIVDSEDGHHLKVHTSFEFTEIGNCDSEEDLRSCGIIGDEVI